MNTVFSDLCALCCDVINVRCTCECFVASFVDRSPPRRASDMLVILIVAVTLIVALPRIVA